MRQIFLDLGIIQIHWYSIILFVAFLIGGMLALKEAKKWKIQEDYMVNLFFYLIPIALIGARLYFVLFNLDYYSVNPIDIFKVWEGGLAIHGGIIAGLIFLIIYTKKYKINTFRMLDITTIGLIIGQAIGRWGNFFNQEAHGPMVSLETLSSLPIPKFIIDGMNINGVYYHPTFFYESIWCIVGFIILLIFKHRKYTKIGQTTSLYLIWYGIGRFLIESLRTDSLMLGNLKVAQLVSILMITAGIIIFIIKSKGSRFDNQYNDERNTNDVVF